MSAQVKRFGVLALLFVPAVVALAACAPAPTLAPSVPPIAAPATAAPTAVAPKAASTIRIGIAISLSGSTSAAGTMLLRGYETWAQMVNNKSGVIGRKVELVTYDDQSQPAVTVKAFQRLIDEDKVDLTFGPYGSTGTFAVSAVTEKAKIPLLATAAGASNIWQRGFKYVFAGEPGELLDADPPLNAAKALGLTKIAVLYDDNSWGQGYMSASTKLAKEYGLEIVHSEAYPVDTKDLTGPLLKARTAGAQVISSSAYLPDSELIARGLKQLNWAPELVFAATARQLEFGKDLGADAEGVTSYAFWDPNLKTTLNPEFQDLFKTKYGVAPSDHASLGFAAGQTMQAAIEAAGTTDPEKVRDQLAKIHVKTVLAGEYAVDPAGMQIGMKVLLVQWQNGKLVVVGPDEYAVGSLKHPLPSWSGR